MELKQITVLLIIIKLLIFSDMCNFFTFIFLIFYLLINSANGFLDYNFARRTYRTTYAPTLFLKDASQTMTLNGETIQHVADYVIPYTVSQKKGSAQTILGAAFSICF